MHLFKFMQMLSFTMFNRLTTKILLSVCWNCEATLDVASAKLCSKCDAQIQRLAYCWRCGNFLPDYANGCGSCTNLKLPWEKMIIAGKFSPPLSNLIHRFKFQREYYLDQALAHLLLQGINSAREQQHFSLPDVIIPTPLHHHRQWKRGFNQSEYLANCLGKWLKIPVDNKFIFRSKNTPPQRGLHQKQRYHNLNQAFSFNHNKLGKYTSIAIVDDVITTGSTMMEISKVAKLAGIDHIHIWGVAHT